MNLINLLNKWETSGQIDPEDLKQLNIFSKLNLAKFWGIKCNIFNVSYKLKKEAESRQKEQQKIEEEYQNRTKIIDLKLIKLDEKSKELDKKEHEQYCNYIDSLTDTQIVAMYREYLKNQDYIARNI